MKLSGATTALLYMIISTVFLPVCFLKFDMQEISGLFWFLGLLGFFPLVPFFYRIDRSLIKKV